MPRLSAGLLVYRIPEDGGLELLIVHPGGPLWTTRDDGAWSIPKGEVEGGDDLRATADREFAEELGLAPPPGPRLDLGEIIQRGGKHVRAFAVAGDIDVSAAQSNLFEMEWPRGSGLIRSFPEVDRAAWFDADEARRKLVQTQSVFVDRLAQALDGDAGS
ncbi:MAG TPA: NUDIX domain-containing protein [Acidimicrobiales bacterium]|jgi:predicted NUDIX family NTP pyrophosphohydrolase